MTVSREPARDEEDGDTEDEEEDSRLYIPGGGLLDNLNTCDLKRLGQENVFDKGVVVVVKINIFNFCFEGFLSLWIE